MFQILYFLFINHLTIFFRTYYFVDYIFTTKYGIGKTASENYFSQTPNDFRRMCKITLKLIVKHASGHTTKTKRRHNDERMSLSEEIYIVNEVTRERGKYAKEE